MNFKSGFISLVGRPNVGKSTLLNSLTKNKISITSHKAQTTRNKIIGICHEKNAQYIFVDTPGVNYDKYLLNQKMNQIAFQSIQDVDLILFLTDSFYCSNKEKKILNIIFESKKPVFLVINKIDYLKQKNIEKIIASYLENFAFQNIIPLSALKQRNIVLLKESIYQKLDFGLSYYPPNMVTDQKKEMWMAEIIREKILYYVHEEVPYASTVVIEKTEQKQKILEIWALILVENNSQKKILIGSKGSKLKQIGMGARKELNYYLNSKIHINLWVKIAPNWRNQKDLLTLFIY